MNLILGILPAIHSIAITQTVCQLSNEIKNFVELGNPNKVWAISAIHSNVDKLSRLHDTLIKQIEPGDKIVYLGNYSGYGENAPACIDEILSFRRMALCMPGMRASDFVYLRGAQEEMWEKLLQLQFAPNPSDVLLWMLGHGMSNTLKAYDLCPHDGIEACRSGIMGLTKWTARIRENQRRHAGHETFQNQLIRAAYTNVQGDYPILFVHAGIDFSKGLNEQGDRLWWGCKNFKDLDAPYDPFQKVVRGYDPAKGGLHLNCVTATLDGGCGFGGTLICTSFTNDGEVAEILET